MVAAYQIGLGIIHRLKKIEDSLLKQETWTSTFLRELKTSPEEQKEKSKEAEKITQETKVVRFSNNYDPETKDIEWIKNNSSDYAILATNESGTHAEAKIIDFLLATGSLIIDTQAIYIGISKACCLHCDDIINAINELFPSGAAIQVTGAHYRTFGKWDEKKPFFLWEIQDEESDDTPASCSSKSSKIKGNSYQPRINSSLEINIRKAFEERQNNFSIVLHSGKNGYNASKKEAQKFLSDQEPKCVVAYFNKGDKSWHYVGRDYASQEINDFKLDWSKSPLDGNSDLMESARKKLLVKAAESFGRKVESKVYMSQDSSHSSASSLSEGEEEIESDNVSHLIKTYTTKILELKNFIAKNTTSINSDDVVNLGQLVENINSIIENMQRKSSSPTLFN